jgi:glycerol kinase
MSLPSPARYRPMGMGVIVGLDAGTTGVRAMAVDHSGVPVAMAYRRLAQHLPRPGWVEHDPNEIWEAVRAVLAAVPGARRGCHRGHQPA